MKMKRHIDLFVFILSMMLPVFAMAAKPYIPSQLEHFIQTGSCVGCDLSEASLDWTNHNDANLNQALLVKICLSHASFNSANFSHAKIMYATLRSLQASGSNFNAADLTASDLSYANLSSANLLEANLTGVNLANADLAWAIVTEKQLARTQSLSCAIMPDGSRHAPDTGRSC
jgi:uncharacterized protein YjbI with pentapeptide repeats